MMRVGLGVGGGELLVRVWYNNLCLLFLTAFEIILHSFKIFVFGFECLPWDLIVFSRIVNRLSR